jgi:hypothetical protein
LKLKVYGLETIDNKKNTKDHEEMNESKKFQLEIEHCDLRSDIAQLEKSNQRLANEIEERKNSIRLLNE